MSNFHPNLACTNLERMSDVSFKCMVILFNIYDFFSQLIDNRLKNFGIKPGIIVVDYGCGPGRYTSCFARLVGEKGKLYAVDLHELAIQAIITMSVR